MAISIPISTACRKRSIHIVGEGEEGSDPLVRAFSRGTIPTEALVTRLPSGNALVTRDSVAFATAKEGSYASYHIQAI